MISTLRNAIEDDIPGAHVLVCAFDTLEVEVHTGAVDNLRSVVESVESTSGVKFTITQRDGAMQRQGAGLG